MKPKQSSRDNGELRENVRRGRTGRYLPELDTRKLRKELSDYFERRRRRLSK